MLWIRADVRKTHRADVVDPSRCCESERMLEKRTGRMLWIRADVRKTHRADVVDPGGYALPAHFPALFGKVFGSLPFTTRVQAHVVRGQAHVLCRRFPTT